VILVGRRIAQSYCRYYDSNTNLREISREIVPYFEASFAIFLCSLTTNLLL
jgi:hypothetical protein